MGIPLLIYYLFLHYHSFALIPSLWLFNLFTNLSFFTKLRIKLLILLAKSYTYSNIPKFTVSLALFDNFPTFGCKNFVAFFLCDNLVTLTVSFAFGILRQIFYLGHDFFRCLLLFYLQATISCRLHFFLAIFPFLAFSRLFSKAAIYFIGALSLFAQPLPFSFIINLELALLLLGDDILLPTVFWRFSPFLSLFFANLRQ